MTHPTPDPPTEPGAQEYRGYIIGGPPSRKWPIAYRDWLIEPCPIGFAYYHKDFDGAPYETGGPPWDTRHGTAKTIEEAKREIDLRIDEMADES